MTFNKRMPASLLAGTLAAFMMTAAAMAEGTVTPEQAEGATSGQPGRFSLVEVDGDILRVDRQNGTVSICREQNTAWRCNPVPLAEDAYLAEINDLAAEVDRLTARLEHLESSNGGEGKQLPPGSALDRTTPDTGTQTGPDSSSEDQTTGLEQADEELEKVLTFTESAMRRLFGMVRELQKDFEDEGNQ
ncbi:MAG: hypothetical protein K5905_02320 [Roseibium sp.]|uniref:hypothetical protein n=1 Tax=Roseibium sp. TaxID=1936156 RepID=UPI00262F70A7|nr:hypothetical protein [Roseibium sp.]MCV0424284.1 hypothetical protein [Roseibium sp.]